MSTNTIKEKYRKTCIDIICSSMCNIPGITWIVGSNATKAGKRLRELGRYVFDVSWTYNGLIFSNDLKGVVILLVQNRKLRQKIHLMASMRFILRCTGLFRAWEIVKREKYIQTHHPQNKDYLYFWIFAVLPSHQGRKTAYELKEKVFEKSRLMRLPIYLETTVLKNKRVYERFGFNVYHTWKIKKRNVTMYFMKRDWRK